MARLLMRHSIVELEQLFSSTKDDIKTLKKLEEELKHRNVPRAVVLLDKVQRALRVENPAPKTTQIPEPAAKPVDKPAESHPTPQGALWSEELKSVPKTVVVTAGGQPEKLSIRLEPVEPPAKASASTVPMPPREIMPSMSVDEAYRVLKSPPGATWEAIEQTRRQLVQQAHPEKIAQLSPERRAQVQADAKRANAAYAVLILAKARDSQG